MRWTEIPIIEYIDTYETQCDVYVHTKDQRVIGVRDVLTNPHLDQNGLYMEHNAFGLEFSFFLPREDFSHIEYRYVQREHPREHEPITKKDFDELNSFVEEQFHTTPGVSGSGGFDTSSIGGDNGAGGMFEDYKYPEETLREP